LPTDTKIYREIQAVGYSLVDKLSATQHLLLSQINQFHKEYNRAEGYDL